MKIGCLVVGLFAVAVGCASRVPEPIQGARGTLQGKHAFAANSALAFRTETGDGGIQLGVVISDQPQSCSPKPPRAEFNRMLLTYVWTGPNLSDGLYPLQVFGPRATKGTMAWIMSRRSPLEPYDNLYTVSGAIRLRRDGREGFKVHLDFTFTDGQGLTGEVSAIECPSVPSVQYLE